ncbi:LysR family transcriptional regulator [Nonomuraea soli]|uniref:DNA-binding transcriptional LysR family regulator n=1 Tax=Nonomuraea soli TaxID=1032476 RepID=A0A7W0HQ11_9ACTN|nr:LysR family transcriptional regulator [Nonomuraea soli]MBA2891428.1 DNA-binding transcriptional LysR family regulator [Nonomuraea soli]
MIDLRQFHVLRAVAVTGSLAGAARLLHHGQPTISYHLDALESHLGAKLVERGPTGAVLTDIGAMVLEHASGVLDRIAAAESDVEARLAHGLATVRVGAFTTAATKLLPRALRHVTAGGGVGVQLTEAEPLELLTGVRSGALHCAIIYDVAGARPRDLRVETLFDDPFRLLLPADRPLDGPVDLGLLADAGWIISTGSYDPSDQILVATCQSLGFRPRIMLRSDNYSVIHAFVATGGVALVPELALEEGHAVVVRDTVQDVGARSIMAVTRPGRQPPAVERLLHSLCGGDL